MSAVKMHMESEVTSTEWPKSKKELKSPVFIACVLPLSKAAVSVDVDA